MNYLAHILLSGDSEDVILGNFMADKVKGRQYLNYGRGVQIGILLHREIDSYTDSHPVFLQGKRRLFGTYRHYSSVILDMFYDHFLAANWSAYSDVPLPDFTAEFYELLRRRQEVAQLRPLPHRIPVE